LVVRRNGGKGGTVGGEGFEVRLRGPG
jgi:hypothetical protein